jgi:hypothetical protein
MGTGDMERSQQLLGGTLRGQVRMIKYWEINAGKGLGKVRNRQQIIT